MGFFQKIIPLHGFILQAGTCQIFSLAEIQEGVECGNTLDLMGVRGTRTTFDLMGGLMNTKFLGSNGWGQTNTRYHIDLVRWSVGRTA